MLCRATRRLSTRCLENPRYEGLQDRSPIFSQHRRHHSGCTLPTISRPMRANGVRHGLPAQLACTPGLTSWTGLRGFFRRLPWDMELLAVLPLVIFSLACCTRTLHVHVRSQREYATHCKCVVIKHTTHTRQMHRCTSSCEVVSIRLRHAQHVRLRRALVSAFFEASPMVVA